MTIFNQGGLNPAALVVPDIIVNVQTPPVGALNGAPSNILGIVGTATWGPKNSPVTLGSPSDYSAAFGAVQARKYDLGTAVSIAAQQGANVFRAVRVTDGTDTAATGAVQSTGLSLTAKYTGTRGNSASLTIATGSAASSFKATIALPGLAPETFDNLTGTGNAFWVGLAAAINNGQSATRGPSNIMVASAGALTAAPTLGATTLTGGTDGTTTITSTVLIGSDSSPRTGMYALRQTGISAFMLADADDNTTWAAQLAFALSESCEAIATSPSGDTLSNFATSMAGVDSPWIKVMFGDWVYWLDGQNNLVRLVSPQAFVAGQRVALNPSRSGLNKALSGVVGTQKSYAGQTYNQADLQALAAARGDVIAMTSVGGAYPSLRFGRNSSSDPVRHQDPYTTMTNFLATSLNASAGRFVGRLQTASERREALASIGGFLDGLWDAGMIGNPQGTQPYKVVIDDTNNPVGQVALGVQKATVQVQYLSIIEYFLIDLTGGQSVTLL